MEVLHTMLDQIERQRLSKMMDEMPDNVVIQQRYCIMLSSLILAEHVRLRHDPFVFFQTVSCNFLFDLL